MDKSMKAPLPNTHIFEWVSSSSKSGDTQKSNTFSTILTKKPAAFVLKMICTVDIDPNKGVGARYQKPAGILGVLSCHQHYVEMIRKA